MVKHKVAWPHEPILGGVNRLRMTYNQLSLSQWVQRQEAARDLSPVPSVHISHCFPITGKRFNHSKTQCLRFKREGKEVDSVQRV